MPIDPMAQRRIMGSFATGVTVVLTTSTDGTWGMTANSLTSLSLDPPLLLVTVDRRNRMHQCLAESKRFSVNVLTAEQEALSRRFAARGPKDFSDLALTVAETGAPVLTEALAFADCRLVQIAPGGDHDIFIGEVIAGDVRDGQPLVFYRGRYGRVTEAAEAGNTSLISPKTIGASYDLYGAF